MADRKISDLTALTTPASGDFLPIVDISEAAAASKNKRITIEELFRGVPLGTAAAPSIAIEGDEDTGVFSPGANQLAVATNGTGRLFVDASGNVSIGTSTFSYLANKLVIDKGSTANDGITIVSSNTSNACIWFADGTTGNEAYRGGIDYNHSTDLMQIYTGANGGVVIDSSGRVGIGTTTVNRKLEVSDAGVDNFIRVNTTGAAKSGIEFASSGLAYSQLYFTNVSPYDLSLLQQYTTGSLILGTNSTEKARLTSSGQLLVGTSSARSVGGLTNQVQVEGVNAGTYSQSWVRNVAGTGGAQIFLGKSRSGSVGGVTIVNNNDQLGGIYWCGADGVDLNTAGASIEAYVDGTPGANDLPSRLVFSTTADGASSPTERLRITSAGVLQIADASNITVGTTTGTKIGTATTQKLGFYNATPVVQPTAVADATDAATVITQLNDLLAKLRTLGIIAT
jgi:hypothetical protein